MTYVRVGLLFSGIIFSQQKNKLIPVLIEMSLRFVQVCISITVIFNVKNVASFFLLGSCFRV